MSTNFVLLFLLNFNITRVTLMSKEYVPFLKKGGSARLTVSTNGCEETVIVQKKGLPNEVTFYIIHHKPAYGIPVRNTPFVSMPPSPLSPVNVLRNTSHTLIRSINGVRLILATI